MAEQDNKNLTHRVIASLSREELEFLDKVGKDSLFSTGHKLSYNQILKGLVDLAMQMGVSGSNVHSKEELEEIMIKKIAEALKNKINEDKKETK